MERPLEQGQNVHAVWSLPHGEYGETVGAEVGFGKTTEIKISQLSGPMGVYDVAEVYEGDVIPVAVHPLMYMAVIVIIAPIKEGDPF